MDEDVELDAKYKSYALQVEKVLKQFESPREWADLCSYLNKLKRVRYSAVLITRHFLNYRVIVPD